MVRRVVRSSSQDLKHMLLSPAGGRFIRPLDGYDEVYPGVLLSDGATALSTQLLKDMRVTHVLNAAQGSNSIYYGGFINTSETYYDRVGMQFLGIPAMDTPSFYLRAYFRRAADFIHDAIKSGGKVLVHCQCGISRSAALVAAYLMLKKGMDVQQALASIRTNRSIFPNQGFLSQLCDLDYELRREGVLPAQSEPVEIDDSQPVKDSIRNRLSSGNRLPNFTSTNYFPLRLGLTRSGYAVTSAYPTIQRDLEETHRARSEERIPSSYRDRSPSPPRYRTVRSTSVLPEAISYYERPRSASPELESYRSSSYDRPVTSILSSYELSRPYQDSFSYLRLSRPFLYSPPRPTSVIYPTGYRALETLAQLSKYRSPSLDRTLTPRDTQRISSRPYESYTYSSPGYQRSFITYTPSESYVPRSYSTYYNSAPSYRSTSIPSVLKYPCLLSPSLYSRIFKA